MCGRFSLTADLMKVASRFDAEPFVTEWKPRYNLAPGQGALAVVVAEGKRQMSLMTFGFIPHWAKEKPKGYAMINARAETIAEKPSYRQSFRSKRCLIPADGFYEWQQTKTSKLPYRFAIKNDELFAFAAVWDSWTDAEGKALNTFAIITTFGNALTGQLHDRMPVILHKEDESTWLDPSITRPEKLQPLLVPYPDTEMKMFRVTPLVNSWRNDTPDCLLPI